MSNVLFLTSVSGPSQKPSRVITQLRLATIQQLQSRIAFEKAELDKAWESVRRDMLNGAKIEEGPIHAFIRYGIRVSKAKGFKSKVSRVMVVK